MYCNVLASTRCSVFASSLHGKASVPLQTIITMLQNWCPIILGISCMECLEWHVVRSEAYFWNFTWSICIFFLPSCRIILSYKFWSKWWTELHSENDRRKVWTNSTWPGSVFHYSKREHHRHWTRGWTKQKCQHCPSVWQAGNQVVGRLAAEARRW